jgi:hypothetical protein
MVRVGGGWDTLDNFLSRHDANKIGRILTGELYSSSPYHPVTIQWSECSIVFSNLFSKFPLFSISFSHDPMVGMFHCLFIVLRIPLFSISFSHDSVIRMFHCLFIVLKIPLYSMPSSHDPVIRMFHCLFIVLKIPLFSIPRSCSLLLYKYLSLMLRNDLNGFKKYIKIFYFLF